MSTMAPTAPQKIKELAEKGSMPRPDLFFDAIWAYQRTAALKAALALDVFTTIADGAHRPDAIARQIVASERGIRILCDYLTMMGLLRKTESGYELTDESQMFLNRNSPIYLGGITEFLFMPDLVNGFDRLADTIRRGTVSPDTDMVADQNPVWVQFARAMQPMMMPAAHAIADLLQVADAGPLRILDIAAGHGAFGITLAQRNPQAKVVALDWPAVLAVARENAARMGVADRYETIEGSAFAVELGGGYDVVLVTNFLHHFDTETCMSLLRRIAGSLEHGGRLAVLEFVPNEDRISPPLPAAFALTMLANTPSGDAYTASALKGMLEGSGFGDVQFHPLPTPQTVITATRS
jgi:2-polyprenyl-3-methyl-5-hydroxy-6-metoxy-1,4-benzoquinol methylase